MKGTLKVFGIGSFFHNISRLLFASGIISTISGRKRETYEYSKEDYLRLYLEWKE